MRLRIDGVPDPYRINAKPKEPMEQSSRFLFMLVTLSLSLGVMLGILAHGLFGTPAGPDLDAQRATRLGETCNNVCDSLGLHQVSHDIDTYGGYSCICVREGLNCLWSSNGHLRCESTARIDL